MDEFISFLVEPYKTYDTWQIVLEIIAAVLGVASTYYSTKRNIWVFPTGIISTGIYIYLLFKFSLYGDMLINVYYTSMSIYGWILWGQATEVDETHVNVMHMNRKEIVLGILLFVFSVLLVLGIYYYRPVIQNNFEASFMSEVGFHYTSVDYIDSGLTATFLIGMWLMARRKLESWYFWILGDVVAIVLFSIKGLGITSLQYFVFLALAIMGYFNWRKQIEGAEKPASAGVEPDFYRE